MQLDPLTRIYNKTASEEIVDAFLEKSTQGTHVLYVIDIDDFKKINDTFGHTVGDMVISDIATLIREQFTDEVIVGRVGGDEFIVFMKDTSVKEAEKKADLGSSDYTAVAAAILEGVGGAANVKSIDNCITRLRLEVKDSSLVNEKKIKSAGAAGVIRPSKTAVQVIIGTKVQFVADEFKKLCK